MLMHFYLCMLCDQLLSYTYTVINFSETVTVWYGGGVVCLSVLMCSCAYVLHVYMLFSVSLMPSTCQGLQMKISLYG